MNEILVKILATALAFSQAATQPDAVKNEFDPERDRAEVARLLNAGCLHMRKSFDIEQINLDDLIATAMDDTEALGSEIKALKGLSVSDLYVAYRQFCKSESVEDSPIDLSAVIAFYNNAIKDLPDANRLKAMKLPSMSVILDGTGKQFAEVFTPNNRRVWTSIGDIPEPIRNAFIAAEDKRFFQHRGLDERGLVRAFVSNLAQPGRPQGGSTITQQVAKNLLVGNDVTYERKLQEIIVASRIENLLTKAEILELYLNSIYLGRGAWGVEMAARGYFGKSVQELSTVEAALLAGLAKGPYYFSPDRNAERARDRLAYVLGRMRDDNMIGPEEAKALMPQVIAYERPRRHFGFHFVDHVMREAKSISGMDALDTSSYIVRSTINPALQRTTEAILQEGLARYELNTGRFHFRGAEANIDDAVRLIAADPKLGDLAWLAAAKTARLPLYDVHWDPAVVLENRHEKRRPVITVGLLDGRILPLNAWTAAIRNSLKTHDVIYVRVLEGKGKQTARAELRIRPTVQGAALVMENKTGRVLAMAGAFSYPASQLNRTMQTARQPGSTFKPLTYLAALDKGLQPNTLIMDAPITLPPIGATGYARPRDFWSPRNFEGGGSGAITLRRALESSRNLATAQLMANGIEKTAEQGLDRVCELAMEAQLYKHCSRYYPFVLGAQPVRLIDLAAFYAAITNEGARPTPHVLEAIEQQGRQVYKRDADAVTWIGSADRASVFQLKSMLQGVLERGTARAFKHLAPYAGGKTGTTDNELDAWFVGFTNDITVALWVGYDNAQGERRTLGRGQTGGKVALPMFEPILQAAWALHAPKAALSKPSPDAMRQLVALRVDPYTGESHPLDSGNGVTEYFKRGPGGEVLDTQYRIVSRGENHAHRGPLESAEDGSARWRYSDRYGDRPFPQQAPWQYHRRDDPLWRNYPNEDDRMPPRPRRVDPDYLFGRRLY